jgi:hypothetical protein
MADEVESLLDAHRAALARYAYFLLAMTALFIGYGLSSTRYSELSVTQLPLAIALGAWVASFLYGCLHVENHFTALRWNAAYLKAKRDRELAVGDDKAAAELETAEKAYRRVSSRMSHYGKQQFRYLVVGGLFYLAWHVSEMVLRTSWTVLSA